MRRDVPFDWKYRKAHPIALAAGGVLERVAGPGPHMVNSLHGQGVDRPGPRVRVEATAPDGVIEAISIADADGFTLGVQWHPEWPRPCAGIDRAIFPAFAARSEEHTSELQSLMRMSYAVFCLKKKKHSDF